MKRVAMLAALVVTLAAATAIAQPALRPVDEAVRRADFFSSRARLQAAVAARDTAAVLAFVDPDIRISFGGDDGREAFARVWRIGDADSPLWRELATMLALGGSFEGDRFVAPYVFSRWPRTIDAFEHVAVIGADVRVRRDPRADAEVIRTVSFAILRLAQGRRPGGALPDWTAVLLPDGRNGYIASAFVRSPVGYRAFFERGRQGWRMTTFVAGD